VNARESWSANGSASENGRQAHQEFRVAVVVCCLEMVTEKVRRNLACFVHILGAAQHLVDAIAIVKSIVTSSFIASMYACMHVCTSVFICTMHA